MEKVIIIGGGPAGIMTAIQLKRFGISPLVLEKKQLGGMLWNANLVENYPGFPSGITGAKLVKLLIKQYQSYKIKTIYETVNSIDYSNSNYKISTDKNNYSSSVLVIASGTVPNRFSSKLISDAVSEKVFYEVYPLLGKESKVFAIVGAGDAAFDYGLNLSTNNTVYILNRSENIRALPLLASRSKKQKNITYLPNHKLISVENIDEKLNLIFLEQFKEKQFIVDYLIGAIGRSENLIPFSNSMENIKNSLVESGKLYYIGDVKNGIFRQTAIAIGDGLKAAMQVYRFLKER